MSLVNFLFVCVLWSFKIAQLTCSLNHASSSFKQEEKVAGFIKLMMKSQLKIAWYFSIFCRSETNIHMILQSVWVFLKHGSYSTVQAFFHQPAHPRGEGATIKRISPPRKPPAGGIAADPRRFRGGFYR